MASNFWTNLGSILPQGRRRGASASEQLARSYRNVFAGNGSRQDAEMMLADLAEHSGFYQVLPSGSSLEELAEANGKRAVYGRIFRFLRLTDAEIRQLEEAARQEALTSQQEGEI